MDVRSEARGVEWVRTLRESRVGLLIGRVRRGRSRAWLELVDPALLEVGVVRVFREDLGALEALLDVLRRSVDGVGKDRR